MAANKIIQAYARKVLTKNQGPGIINLPGAMQSEAKAGEIVALLQRAGIPMNQLDDFIRSEKDLLKFLNLIKAASEPRVISATSPEGKAITEKLFGKKGEVIKGNFGKPFKEEIEAMKKSGDIVDPNNLKKNDNVLTRELFRDSTLNKEPVNEKFIKYTIQDINKKDPIEGMKIANKIIKKEGEFKDLTEEQSKRILKETDDHLTGRDMDYDPEDFYATGGRAGFYTGGITDVEPSLDDIGHGSDSLMSRTRLMSPGSQATTSTGLNYLLAEDNDNLRVPFAAGGDPKRRAFLKLLATLGGGIAAAKTGILGLGKGGGKQITKEVAKEVATGSGTPPPYFFKLVEKIKMLGDDVTVGSATLPRTKVTRYKDYQLTENLDGSKQIQKIGKEDDMITKDEYMTYTKGQADETTKGKKVADDYEEVTEINSRIYKDNFNDPDYEDGINLKEILEEVGETVTKKADGGRIGLFLGGFGAKNQLTQGKSLLKNMLKFLSKDGSYGKSPAEILKMLNPKQFEKLLNDPRYQGKVSSEAPEGLDKIIQDMINKTKIERSDMVADIIGSSRNIKKVDDNIIKYKTSIIEDMVSKGIDKEVAVEAAESMSKEVIKNAGKKSTPKITEQGLLELENIQKNLLTKGRKLQATGGLTTMLGE
jgi:hypothetical protein